MCDVPYQGFSNVDKSSLLLSPFFWFQITMFTSGFEKLRFLYKPYALGVVTIGYVCGELGHYLIGKLKKKFKKI